MYAQTNIIKVENPRIDELLERLDEIGEYPGSITDFFTLEEQLILKTHFSRNQDKTLFSSQNLKSTSVTTAWCAMNNTNEFGTFDISDGSTVTTIGAEFKLFPNPTDKGYFTIYTPGLKGEVSLSIKDLHNRTILSQDSNVSGESVRMNTGHLQAGVYLVKLTQGNETFSSKLIVE
jgi:hypothetical protein